MTETQATDVETAGPPAAGETILDRAISQIEDEQLRLKIAREVDLLRGSRRFGLVFDRHLPESVRLVRYPIRKGVKVTLRDESSEQTWRVARFTDLTKQTVVLDDGTERPAADLVVIREFGEPVYPGLRSVERIANGEHDDSWHAVINGENYHVLQALRTTHRGKIDLIYIDPPYNTGNDGWIYNDRYVDTNDRAKSSKWLSFVERRLEIAKTLLKPTGVIVVAIGDDEHHRLRMLLDQVFGGRNFISDVVWQGGRKNDSRYVSNGADYMLIYARDEGALSERGTRWREKKSGVDEALAKASEIWNATDGDHAEAQRQWRAWVREFRRTTSASDAVTRFVTLDANGRPIRVDADLRSPNPRPNLQYDLLHPVTGKPVRMHPNGWRYSREVMAEMVSAGRVHFGPDESSGAGGVSRLDEMDTQAAESVFTRDRNAGTAAVRDILGDRRFPNPKDVDVLMRWIRLAAPKDAIILDFFGGSGSTTEAVLRLNVEDGGTRQSILVTNNEVGPKAARELRKREHHPGDAAWAAKGVFEYVTRPRISTVVTGVRPDGSTYSDGLPANVEFFDLTYLDPGTVRRGREFEAIAPLLWLEAGATGERIDAIPSAGWAVADNYGVLFDVDAAKEFIDTVTERAKVGATPARAFIITDSVAAFQAVIERLPTGVMPVRLFEDYLTNFTANTDQAVSR